MIGLVAAYYFGKDRAHKQAAKPSEDTPSLFLAITFCFLGGVENGLTGATIGLMIAFTIYYAVGMIRARNTIGIVFGLTVVAGGWIGAWLGDWYYTGTFWGALWGFAVFLGCILPPVLRRWARWASARWERVVAYVAARRPVEPAKSWDLTGDEVEEARWLYATDDEYAAEVDALRATDPALAEELSGGLTRTS